MAIKKEDLKGIKTIGIFGETGSGKTALSYYILDLFKGEDIYFVKHPKPELIKPFGYKNLRNLEEIERLSNCVIFWDEPQLSIGLDNKKKSIVIAKICSLARQRNITLIMATSDTRVFTRHNESFIDAWFIKDLDYEFVKNGSRIKKAIRESCFIDPCGFRLEKNEFLFDCRLLPELCTRHKFNLIKGWNDSLSRPYNL